MRLQVAEDVMEAVAGTLKTAKKHKVVSYEAELLMQVGAAAGLRLYHSLCLDDALEVLLTQTDCVLCRLCDAGCRRQDRDQPAERDDRRLEHRHVHLPSDQGVLNQEGPEEGQGVWYIDSTDRQCASLSFCRCCRRCCCTLRFPGVSQTRHRHTECAPAYHARG